MSTKVVNISFFTFTLALLFIGIFASMPIVDNPTNASAAAQYPTGKIELPEALIPTEGIAPSVAWTESGITLLYTNGTILLYQDARWEARQLAVDPQACNATHFYYSTTVDNQLLFVRQCYPKRGAPQISILQYDIEQDRAVVIIPPGLLTKTGRVSYSRDMRLGTYQSHDGFNMVYWVRGTKLQAIPLRLSSGDKEWFLPDTRKVEARYLETLSMDTPYPVGSLQGTSLSAAGDFAVFAATLEPMGKPMPALSGYRWDIIMVNTQTLEMKKVVTSVRDAYIHDISPDGNWIAYSEGATNLWAVNTQTTQRTLLYEHQISDMAWHPRGNQIAVLKCLVATCREYELLTIDTSTLGTR